MKWWRRGRAKETTDQSTKLLRPYVLKATKPFSIYIFFNIGRVFGVVAVDGNGDVHFVVPSILLFNTSHYVTTFLIQIHIPGI